MSGHRNRSEPGVFICFTPVHYFPLTLADFNLIGEIPAAIFQESLAP